MKTENEIRKLYNFHLKEIRECKGKGSGWEKKRHERAIEILAWVLS